MNQRSSTTSAIESTPSALTLLARASYISGSNRAAVQHSTRRSTRSGASLASHMPTSPPMERPQNEVLSISNRSSMRQRVSPEVFYLVGTGRDWRITMPALVVAHKAETLAENRRLVVPHPERGAQRVGQDEYRRPPSSRTWFSSTTASSVTRSPPHDIVSEPGPRTPLQTRGVCRIQPRLSLLGENLAESGFG